MQLSEVEKSCLSDETIYTQRYKECSDYFQEVASTKCKVCGRNFAYLYTYEWSKPKTCSKFCKERGRELKRSRRYAPSMKGL
jgi:hypothetical protein